MKRIVVPYDCAKRSKKSATDFVQLDKKIKTVVNVVQASEQIKKPNEICKNFWHFVASDEAFVSYFVICLKPFILFSDCTSGCFADTPQIYFIHQL